MKNKWQCWMVVWYHKELGAHPLFSTIRETRKESIKASLSGTESTWKWCYSRCYRCEKFDIRKGWNDAK